MSKDPSPAENKFQQTHVKPDSSPSGGGAAGQRPTPTSSNSGAEITKSSTFPELAGVNESQSTTMSSTTPSSEVAGADPASSSATPAPYGTRSRGRNAAPRPNYAEDRDIDMDLEVAAPASKPTKKDKTALNNIVNGSKSDGEKTPSANSRRSLTSANGTNSAPTPKEAIPGTSTFSAKPEENNSTSSSSKKRKQPPSTANSNNAGGSAAKKVFTSAPGAGAGGQFALSNMMTFESTGAYLKGGKLTADDGTVLGVNDHVYLICEPPGEPYYLARIMEFLPSKEKPSGPIEAIRVNWYYRPRDIGRHLTDTRLVFATMHSDTCPITSLRGKCQISHSAEIDDMDEYRKTRDSFWYAQLFDRYIHRYYDVIPTKKVINVPANVKRVLDERWKFVLVEVGRRKELTSEVKTCKRCGQYAASADSVECAVCHDVYHMYCVRPALTKKPARGFAWACAACSLKQEKAMEKRNTPALGESQPEVEEIVEEEEEEEPNGAVNGTTGSTPAPTEEELIPRPATEEQRRQARMWPYRYLGIHCRVEDALDYDDRIYPRASSRLGPRHQANVPAWFGHPVKYVKPIDIKKKHGKSGRKDGKLSKEALAAIEAAKQERAKQPKWVMDEPTGFVPRGEDEPVMVNGEMVRTVQLLFRMPTASELPSRGEEDAPAAELSPAERERLMDDYMARAKKIAPEIGLKEYSTNFLDKALQLLFAESYNVESALAKLRKVDKFLDLKEPRLKPKEVELFEEGVAIYGSELRRVTQHVGSVPHAQIVRFYYMWKKTPKGRQIWGNYEGRRGKAKRNYDVADDHDDSAFDNEKAAQKKRCFQCKFCSTRTSRQWRRAPTNNPGDPPETLIKKEKGSQFILALCLRCALLWRKYGIRWDSIDEMAKKAAQSGNKSSRRRLDEELLAQILVSAETPVSNNNAPAATAASMGTTANANPQLQQDSGKKKGKPTDKDSAATSTATSVEPAPKKKAVVEKVPEPPPLLPDPPKAKTLPCAICNQMEPMGNQHLSCRDCRLTVHRSCYGVDPTRNCTKWFCDMCSNDRNPVISTTYECVLCPVTWTEHELMEPPKTTHKKKTDREREKERLEKEMVTEAIKLYRQRQNAVGKPVGPREPLKRTAGNNWVHVLCALFNPEIKFANAQELEPAEGFALIPHDRFREVCKICKTSKGACVPCHHAACNAHFHVGCAFQAQYRFGFDITPVKSSRRDSVSTIKLGDEAGAASAAIWCPEHTIQASVHELSEPTGQDGLNALQLFAQTYKQADLSLPGTVRRAAYVQQSVSAFGQNGLISANRRASTVNGVVASQAKESHRTTRTSPDDAANEMVIDSESHPVSRPAVGADVGQSKRCTRCSATFSPRWWPVDTALVRNGTPLLNGVGPHAASASPPFHTQNPSQHSFSKPSGEFVAAREPEGSQAYECHKCHLKAPAVQPSPEPRPSPYAAQRPVLPAPRLPEYHNAHPYGPHAHPTPPAVLPRPMGPTPSHGGPGWSPGYEQRSAEYTDAKIRNGMAAPGYHGAPPPPPHVNGYQPPHHAPPPPYANGAPPPPPPQAYMAHQSPYGPVSVPSPHIPHAAGPRPYAASASPPDVHSTMVRHSPQHSLAALNGGPPPRVYSVERVLSAPARSPSIAQAHVEPQGPNTPGKLDETPVMAAARPPSSGRHTNVNGTSGGSGASASPSLKNLLS